MLKPQGWQHFLWSKHQATTKTQAVIPG